MFKNENQAISLFYLFFETSLALSSSLPRVVTSSLKSSKLSRSCQNRILYQFYYMSCYALCLGNTADAWSHRAGSLSAIYNVHLGRHSDIPKFFRPPYPAMSLTFYVSFSRCTYEYTYKIHNYRHTNTQIQLYPSLLSRHVPHILCLRLHTTQHCHSIPAPSLIPKVFCV